MLTHKQLLLAVPGARRADAFLDPLIRHMATEEINTPERITAFLAQLGHESGSFRYVEEIASGEAYEGRTVLGNIQRGDGVRFKGRGLIQITGRANYQAVSLVLFGDDRLLDEPELLEQPEYAVASAAWYWASRGLNALCDHPKTWKIYIKKKNVYYNKFQYITYKINGGQTGYADRLARYNKARKAYGLPPF